jgi:hypothetical protein
MGLSLVELFVELSSGAVGVGVFAGRQLNTWCFRQLAQRRQLCFRHKLCLALAVAELGFSHHLGSLEAVLVVLVLCLSTLSSLVSFFWLCSFSACYNL